MGVRPLAKLDGKSSRSVRSRRTRRRGKRETHPQKVEAVRFVPSGTENMALLPAVRLAPVGAVRAEKGLMVGLETKRKNEISRRVSRFGETK